jgi:hypothetical protein
MIKRTSGRRAAGREAHKDQRPSTMITCWPMHAKHGPHAEHDAARAFAVRYRASVALRHALRASCTPPPAHRGRIDENRLYRPGLRVRAGIRLRSVWLWTDDRQRCDRRTGRNARIHFLLIKIGSPDARTRRTRLPSPVPQVAAQAPTARANKARESGTPRI